MSTPDEATPNDVNAPPQGEKEEEIHIDDAIEMIGNGRFQRRILWAAGLSFAADSMEILLMSLLSVVLASHWDLREHHTSTLVSSVFLGSLVGTLVLGPLADERGRKPIFRVTSALIAFFGFWTAMCNSFIMLLLCRFMVGFGGTFECHCLVNANVTHTY